MLGTVTNFTTVNGMSDVNGNYNDVSPYQNFDGGSISDVEMGDDFDSLEYSNATGRRRRRKKSKRFGASVRSRMQARQKARADRKSRKLSIKEQEARTQKSVADALSKDDSATAKLMQQIATDDSKTTEATGMSKGLKTGLIIGSIVLVVGVGFVVYKKMKKTK
jgi:hypothetical protein